MRWQDVLADVEAQADAAQRLETEAEAAERTRIEVGAVRWQQRWTGAVGAPVTCVVATGGQLRGRVVDAGEDWVLLSGDDAGETLVALAAVEAVTGLGSLAAPDAAPVGASAVTLRWLLRRLARDRATVRITTRSGSAWTGVIARVAADHVDLVVADAPDAPRLAVPVAAVVSVVRR